MRTVENRGIDTELFNAICESYDNVPIYNSLAGFSFEYFGEGTAGIKMIAEPNLSTQDGRLHGGVVASLLDTVMGAAVITQGHHCLTLDMFINYFAPAFQAIELKAEGRIIKMGGTIISAEGNLFDSEGKLLATSRGTFIRNTKKLLIGDI